jgi:sugar lactone lactonase YvrE
VADRDNHRVRRIDPRTGIINTVAGNGQKGFSGDGGPATAAQFDAPHGVAVDRAGNLYIVDQNNSRIRKVDAGTGIVTTFAGGGSFGRLGDGGPANAAYLSSPADLAFDSAGNLYFSDRFNNRIRKVAAGTGIITTVAGTGQQGTSGNNGPASSAQLYFPESIAIDAADNLYVVDNYTLIRKIDGRSGIITAFAGGGTVDNLLTGTFSPTGVKLAAPSALAFDADGNLYIADVYVRKISAATGLLSTVVGGGVISPPFREEPLANSVSLAMNGVAVDAAGNLFVTSGLEKQIFRVKATTGRMSAFAGIGGGTVGDGGPATGAMLSRPTSIVFDADGNMLIADSSNNRIRRVDARTGIISTVAGTGAFGSLFGESRPALSLELGAPTYLALDRAGNIYVSAVSQILKIAAGSGMATVVAGDFTTNTRITFPGGLALDGAGNLYFSESFDHRIRRLSTSGALTTFAGTGTAQFSGDGGPATAASLDYPRGIAIDSADNLYVADQNNRRIRKVVISSGVISTHAFDLFFPSSVAFESSNLLFFANSSVLNRITPSGSIQPIAGVSFPWGYAGDNGPATSAMFYFPYGMAVDAQGNIYIADTSNDRIRAIRGPLR